MKKILYISFILVVSFGYGAQQIFEQKLREPDYKDMHGSWRAEMILYYGKVKLELLRERVIYNFKEDGEGSVIFGGEKKVFRWGYKLVSNEISITNLTWDGGGVGGVVGWGGRFSLRDIIFNRAGFSGSTVILNKGLYGTDKYLYEFMKEEFNGDEFIGEGRSIIVLGREAEGQTIGVGNSFGKGSLLRNGIYDYDNIVKYLFGKRILIHKGLKQKHPEYKLVGFKEEGKGAKKMKVVPSVKPKRKIKVKRKRKAAVKKADKGLKDKKLLQKGRKKKYEVLNVLD